MLAFIILYQNVTFKNIFHLWNDILFSADLIKAVQTNPPNQQLILKCVNWKWNVLWNQVLLSSFLGILLF